MIHYGMIAIIIFSPLWLGSARPWPLTLILLSAYSFVFIWLWRMNNGRARPVVHTSLDRPIFIFAALAVLSTVFSIYKHDSLYALVKLFAYIGIYYLVVNEFDRRWTERVLYIVIAMGAALSCFGILQYAGLLGHSWWDPKEFMAATFVNHNHFSGYLELAIPVAAAFLLKRTLARKLFALVALMIMVTALILAQSRGAWLSLSAALLVMAYLMAKNRTGRQKKALILIALLIAVASLAFFSSDIISERVSGSISAGAEGDSLATRLKIWQGTLDMIMHNPVIGTGIGTFAWGFPGYRPQGMTAFVNFAHNDYLETACEMGLPGLLVMLWIIIVVIKAGVRRKGLSPERLGCVIGVLSLSLHAMTDFNFHIPANMLLFTMYLAIVMKEEC